MMRYLLLLVLCSPLAQAQQTPLLERLLLFSGLEAVVSSYPEQIQAQFERRDVSGPDEQARQTARQRLLDAYQGMDRAAELRAYVMSELQLDELKTIVAWFESSLGQRLMVAEQNAGTTQGRRAMRDFLVRFDQEPTPDERIRLVQQFEQVARLSAINLTVIRSMYESEFLAINAALEQPDRLSALQLHKLMQQQFYSMRDMMLPGLSSRLLAVSYFTLSEFSDDEIQVYIDFLNSTAGRRLISLYERVPVYMFSQVVRYAGVDVAEGFFLLP